MACRVQDKTINDVLELVDWGGREIKHNKRDYIPAHAPPILTRLRMGVALVLNYLSQADQPSFNALGPVSMLRAFAQSIGQRFVKGQVLGISAPWYGTSGGCLCSLLSLSISPPLLKFRHTVYLYWKSSSTRRNPFSLSNKTIRPRQL